jgi:uncharacterized protein YprB with RNaseH-like and TPR domain
MSFRDDENLREVLEALTRLRLSHDRYRVRQDAELIGAAAQAAAASGGGGMVTESVLPTLAAAGSCGSGRLARPVPTAMSGQAAAVSVAESVVFPPWLDEVGGESDLATMVSAREATASDADGSDGCYLRREVAVETRLPHLRGLGHALMESLPEAAGLAGMVQDIDLLAAARPEDLLFLDLETTGLHRGIIVLLGFMEMGPGERPLTVTQLFPRDYNEEAHLLGEFIERLRRRPILITFNGRSFDAPFLESRLRFHGWFEPLHFAHVDLLYLARKLWRGRLPNFKLQTIERRIFGRKRLADLPGSQVPRVWEDYVNFGELRHLPGIWEHNLRDLTTLAEIVIRAAHEEPDDHHED